MDASRTEKCETCQGKGYYDTGAFVGDDVEDLRPIMAWCPDCPVGLAKAEAHVRGVDPERE